jgi:uncharacterized membrane protein YphA (DoxX/SURF4 family)
MTTSSDQKSKEWVGHKFLSLAARVTLALTFIWASWHKVADPGEFALTVATYQILPLSLINIQAIGLPWLELIIGVMLIVGIWTREASLITVGMNIMFIVAIVITLYRGEEIMCGCFASADAGHEIGWDLVVRDFGLMIVGIFLIWVGPRWLALDQLIARRRENSDEKS